MTVEEKAEKELRTIFVGNLPIECIEKVHFDPAVFVKNEISNIDC